ncbi:hypothetical protein [Citrobacter koseri]|uniref:hypothetical protein n=1 Tax=Citrobacter koseri TaxID=545 RepID=UPI000DFBE5FC|nr:hypothetical protein [Citrobacter koseri]STB73287.1 Uncharacterised protein [Citrobacter koseri]STT23467.1 Uncharacterised protein [Citrobacter koseri]
MRNAVRRLYGHLRLTPSVRCHLKAQVGMCLDVLAARSLRRRLCWLGRVMISRRRTVTTRTLGTLSVNGMRLWLLCICLVLWVLVRVS